MVWTPADYIELVKAVFYGIAAVCVPLATVYIMITANRVKDLGINVDRLEKNTNSISERNQAIAMKLGVSEGIAQERASVQANVAPALAAAVKPAPVPVADDRTAVAAERSAAATERVADAAEK